MNVLGGGESVGLFIFEIDIVELNLDLIMMFDKILVLLEDIFILIINVGYNFSFVDVFEIMFNVLVFSGLIYVVNSFMG